jgi:hypothetical protein
MLTFVRFNPPALVFNDIIIRKLTFFNPLFYFRPQNIKPAGYSLGNWQSNDNDYCISSWGSGSYAASSTTTSPPNIWAAAG